MNGSTQSIFHSLLKPLVIAAAILLAYFSVVAKLGHDWWTDENYSHGLLVPFVIGFIVWNERDKLIKGIRGAEIWPGAAIIALAMLLLAGGTLGAELFTQRISLAMMLAGIVIYFFGRHILSLLAVPLALLLLAVPIPQIVFNRIAFPLQIWASQMAVWGIRLFDVPVVRNGNVIDILPRGAAQTLSLEVVEACSGIRSLSTLITLALVLAFVTRRDRDTHGFANFSRPDLFRAILLMVAAIPIAVLTNAARVTATGVGTYLYGQRAAEGTVHEASGWLVYVVALAILIGVNLALKKLFSSWGDKTKTPPSVETPLRRIAPWLPVVALLLIGGVAINWFVRRGEVNVPRTELAQLPQVIGDWRQRGSDFKFDDQVEAVLGATDYSMREYTSSDGRVANIYVGYYASQRTGATYHSPQNCLPGAGWVLSDPQTIKITSSDGRVFEANRYIIENGIYREVMIYWYQGRGRIEASEYLDKINTVFDSITRRRTDGAMVRVMTDLGPDDDASIAAASDLAARLEERLTPFVPE